MIVGMSPDSVPSVDQLDSEALRTLARQLMQQLQVSESRNQQLLHELAILRRHRFGARSEQSAGVQGSLLDETIEADLADIEQQLQRQSSRTQVETRDSAPPKRQALPPELPRIDHHHEPDSTICACGCQLQRIGQDVTEKLDHVPSMLTVQRHIRGKWVCRQCQTLVQAPMPAQIIDKGLATSGLLAQVLVSKFADHLPLYRQEQIFMRAGVRLVRSTLAQWVGSCGAQLQPLVDALRESILAQSVLQADETLVQMLQPGSGKTHRAYLWAYTPGVYESLKAVVYDFTEGRAGAYARAFLGDWQGQLVCDDYGGYKACFEQGITEVGCMAHARRKFFELHDRGKSLIAEQALVLIGQLYGVEAQARDMTPQQRQALRQQQARPVAAALYAWMREHRLKVPDNTGIARALDYSLKRWQALTHYLDDGRLPIDNNHTENQIRPIALGRKNWLFAGSLRSGKRAAAIMSLIQSAKLNGHDPYAYLRDVLERLPTHPNNRINELLPHNWTSSPSP